MDAYPDGAVSVVPVYRRVFEEAPVAMALLDADLRIVEANRELVSMLGLQPGAVEGRPIDAVLSRGPRSRVGLMARKAVSGGGPVVVEHRYPRGDGLGGWARTSIRQVDDAGPGVRAVCVLQDLTNDQMALEEQRRQAELDPLTGLLNRRGGDRRIRGALERLAQSGPVAVIVCDVDRFKQVNDRFGHAAGDEVLASTAGRLRATIRGGDDVARMGGDEFIVVAKVSDEHEAAALADRCVRVVGQPLRLGGAGVGPERVTISAGVAVAHPGGPVEPRELIGAADRALYAAKSRGGAGWVLAVGEGGAVGGAAGGVGGAAGAGGGDRHGPTSGVL
jgi:diguanylate cyclase (GGDEF)-like protein/PAS domain S-box-containing protein